MHAYTRPTLGKKEVLIISNDLLRTLIADHVNSEGYAFAELKWTEKDGLPYAEMDCVPMTAEAAHPLKKGGEEQ